MIKVTDAIRKLNINDYTHVVCKRRLSAGNFDYVKGGYAKIFIDSIYGNLIILETIIIEGRIIFIVE